MFKKLSVWLKGKLLTSSVMEQIIEMTVDCHLRHDYDYFIFDEMPPELIEMHDGMQRVEVADDLTGVTFAAEDDLIETFKAEHNLDRHGFIAFSLKAIENCCRDFGIIETIKIIHAITLHECRHAEQFEFLRERGGSALIGRVTEDQRNVPYLENIFEIDAYYYQFTGIKTDFEIVFARYLK